MPTLATLAARFGGELCGGGDMEIHAAASLANAGAGDIVFYESSAGADALARCGASAVLLSPENAGKSTKAEWIVPNPRAHFARLCHFLSPPKLPKPGISPMAVVGKDVKLGDAVCIAPFAIIGEGAVVKDGAIVGENAVVGGGCVVGKNTRLHPRVVLYDGAIVGDGCILHAGVVVGADGFGFVRDDGGQVKIPHLGGVRIGDNVEIGANTCIDRGTLDDTIIMDGAKIDNLVQIGHNVRIGRGSVVCGCVGIAGSAIIGEGCVIGGAADIGGHLTIGDGAIIGGSSAVVNDIAAGQTVSSVWPAVAASMWRRYLAKWRRANKGRMTHKTTTKDNNEY
ncbi:MAG: UDP-3-O-(3-hydroxymyristoyl)glucosamine N-acyltransferase [Gammaproteobacteria bacterium]